MTPLEYIGNLQMRAAIFGVLFLILYLDIMTIKPSLPIILLSCLCLCVFVCACLFHNYLSFLQCMTLFFSLENKFQSNYLVTFHASKFV